ncbi:hypothetical protein P171DRAFT_428902 [Karstenula rhodostoma CBS 690.94]|uniref:SET domain-containing protein n=1 Tax=Karstenula rhodostoma CBS 690.94 TaxID=1392251 RepID=A0A9P4PU97_9PLEO|nr:hypothetical protein P171DRAFT_428902 [Karstenula rhodostoma CBS 690.94]
MAFSVLEPYPLTGPNKELLDKCLSEPAPFDLLEFLKSRPRPSQFARLHDLGTWVSESDENNAYRSIARTCERFTKGAESPSAFMRTPAASPYSVVNIKGKGRGLRASRHLKAGEVVLQEEPILIAPFEMMDPRVWCL